MDDDVVANRDSFVFDKECHLFERREKYVIDQRG